MNKLVKRVFFVTLLILLLIPGSAFAYMGTGSWPTKTIPYKISSDVPSSHVTPINTAASNWQANSILHVPMDNTNYKIIAYVYSYGYTGWDGQAFINPGWDSVFTSGNIQLNYTYTNSYSTNQINVLAAHELGHEFSLDHVGVNTSLMYTSATEAYANNPSLANGPDQANIDRIYNRYAVKPY